MSASAPFGKEEQREARRLDLRVIKENGIIHTRRKSEVQNKIPFSPSPQETYKPDTYLLKMYTQEINAPLQNRSLGNFEKKKNVLQPWFTLDMPDENQNALDSLSIRTDLRHQLCGLFVSIFSSLFRIYMQRS